MFTFTSLALGKGVFQRDSAVIYDEVSLTKSPTPSPNPVFTTDDITSGPFFSMSTAIPLDVCPATSVSYTMVIPVDEGAMRIPHSTIHMNGLKCGPLSDNATLQELWMDTYMELTPITHLTSKTVAKENGVLAIFNRLYTRRAFTRALYNATLNGIEANLTRPMVYIGLERYSPRICGNSTFNISLPYNTFVFIGMFDTTTNFAPFVPYDDNIQLRVRTPFHITFAEGDPLSLTEPEITCPYHRPTPTPTPRPPNIRMCVPANALLTSHTGKSFPVYQARLGDLVFDKSGKPTRIIAFSHRDHLSMAQYIHLRMTSTTGKNISLMISHGHFVPISKSTFYSNVSLASTILKTAGELKTGDQVFSENGTALIVDKTTVWESGIFNVHTLSGSVLVNGIVISCYTTAVPPSTAHALLTPVRVAVNIISKIISRPS